MLPPSSSPLLQRRARRQHGWKRKERGKEERLSRSGPAALEGSLGGPFRLSTKNTIYRLDVHRTTDVRQPSLITGEGCNLKYESVQGISKRLFPGCKNMWWKNCAFLPAEGKQSAIFSPDFTQSGKSLLEMPCTIRAAVGIFHMPRSLGPLHKLET